MVTLNNVLIYGPFSLECFKHLCSQIESILVFKVVDSVYVTLKPNVCGLTRTKIIYKLVVSVKYLF